MWNGDKTKTFIPTRGIRQGDPLSPYMFVICMERLSHIITDQVEANYWKPMRAGRYGPQISHLLFVGDLLLFAEASIDQAHCVMHCLDLFCQAFGQKINTQKTQIFFSKNVDEKLRDDILQHTGFSQVNSLGKYLGAHLSSGRTNRCHFNHIIQKIQTRLTGWKQQCLCLAGRVSLSNSVLNTIPYYHMQYASIPKSICDEIEKIQRNFVWGDTEQGRKAHLIGWDMCCQQKIHGGLGIKKPHIMNEVFLMKILWNLIHKPNDLWCKVLLRKYGRNNDIVSSCISQPYDSQLWKALSKVSNNVELLHSASRDHIDTTLSVRDVLNQDGDWDVRFISENLSNDIVSQVMALPAPTDVDGPDTLGWAGTNTHQFTVRSAYTLQHVIAMPLVAEGDWKTLWGWKGPHCIQTFMWLAAHERILTNARRSKWGVGISPTCVSCMREDETTLHVLRDCVHATRVWIRLVPSNYITNFFSFNCREWIFDNINKKGFGASKDGWQTTFMTTCWLLWTWRNKSIFEDNFQRPHDPIRVIQKYSMDIDHCTFRRVLQIPQRNETIYIGWKKPPEGWIKLNSDGACKGNNDISGCGGLFRNSDGRWIKGYAKKIGSCDSFHAEMWGLYLGLDMAWRDHISHLIVESDSKLLIDMITGNCNIGGVTPILIRRIPNLLALDWQVQIRHTWREGNISADWLANYSISMSSFNCSIIESPPSELRSLFFDDLSGTCMPRNIRINL
ncbi:unnamed protein product [Trifolium pratense]|uniref:Uncharacterized protein n=1 Tax=Trifolium pratense TaxID=57577 RepID=A0ACB0I708_TRIPR|nr:unnamed protein product [Trifolium pratense]